MVTSSGELAGRPHEEQNRAFSITGALQEGQEGMWAGFYRRLLLSVLSSVPDIENRNASSIRAIKDYVWRPANYKFTNPYRRTWAP